MKILLGCLLILLVLAFQPVCATNYAYVVGMTDYKHEVDIYGGVDAKHIGNILSKKGYDVSYTLDSGRNIVVSKLKGYSKIVNSQDTFLFYFSGHGIQEPDYSGREIDNIDEGIVFVNYGYNRHGKLVLNRDYILDDELSYLLGNIHARNMVIILDSCYSGGFIWDIIKKRKTSVIIITSSRESELSYCNSNGSLFTNIFLKNFKESFTEAYQSSISKLYKQHPVIKVIN